MQIPEDAVLARNTGWFTCGANGSTCCIGVELGNDSGRCRVTVGGQPGAALKKPSTTPLRPENR